jgi:zinc/manganese transport system permease protein
MPEAFSHMWWPLLACFVLVGIHAYLGIHVIARKVIFVDLALAQIAALGAVYGVFIGLSFANDPWMIKGISTAFTLLGALLFSFTRTPDEKLPHEAIIGIIYAVALSTTLLLTANLVHGPDEVQQMLAGNILWVTPSEVIYTAVLYALVGVIHIIFRRQFFALSKQIDTNKSLNVKLWDFLFYATFGVVVTSSVGIGGVLLVFGYLVIPSVIGIMLAESTIFRLLIGWGSGLLMSLIGVIISYFLDLPSGPTIVVLLGLLLLFIVVGQEIHHPSTRNKGMAHVGLLSIIMLLIVVFAQFYQKSRAQNLDEHEHHLTNDDFDITEKARIKAKLLSNNADAIADALLLIKEHQLADLLGEVTPLLSFPDDKVRIAAIQLIKNLGDERHFLPLKNAAEVERDDFIKIEIAEAELALGKKEGLLLLHEIATKSDSLLAKDDAIIRLREYIKGAPADDEDLLLWLDKNYPSIRYEASQKKYILAE